MFGDKNDGLITPEVRYLARLFNCTMDMNSKGDFCGIWIWDLNDKIFYVRNNDCKIAWKDINKL